LKLWQRNTHLPLHGKPIGVLPLYNCGNSMTDDRSCIMLHRENNVISYHQPVKAGALTVTIDTINKTLSPTPHRSIAKRRESDIFKDHINKTLAIKKNNPSRNYNNNHPDMFIPVYSSSHRSVRSHSL